MEIEVEGPQGPMEMVLDQMTPTPIVQSLMSCFARDWNPRDELCIGCALRSFCMMRLATESMTVALSTVNAEDQRTFLGGDDAPEVAQLVAENLETTPEIAEYLVQVRRKLVGFPTLGEGGALCATPYEPDLLPNPEPAPVPKPPKTSARAVAPSPKQEAPLKKAANTTAKKKAQKAPEPVAPPPPAKAASKGKAKESPKEEAPVLSEKVPVKPRKGRPMDPGMVALEESGNATTEQRGKTIQASFFPKKGGWLWRTKEGDGEFGAWSKTPQPSLASVQREFEGGHLQSQSAKRFWRIK